MDLLSICSLLLQAFSGLDQQISVEAETLGNTALDAALNAQFLVQIGVFTAVPMIMGFILELGLLKVSLYIYYHMMIYNCCVCCMINGIASFILL